MDGTTAFFTVKRREAGTRPVTERLRDSREVTLPRDEAVSCEQASRCISCFLPFCHWSCPLGNYVPDWNASLARGQWKEAFRLLQATNNLPEVTGRICPAPCEGACVLEQQHDAVTIRVNELEIIEHAFAAGWVTPQVPRRRSGKRVAIVGSGPAGLACADQLNQAGHQVTLFERDDRPGGILRYGIPDFKLEKRVLDRRLDIWRAEGIEFVTGVDVGRDVPVATLLTDYDAACLAVGSRRPRDLAIEGRQLRGIHFAMEYLTQANRLVAGAHIPPEARIDAQGKRVVVLGGGDTGADCVGTAHRQGARQVMQLELLPRPPDTRGPFDLWPDAPVTLKTSTSHAEGGAREWGILTKQFLGEAGAVRALSCVRVEWVQADSRSRPVMRELPDSAFEVEAELVLLAMGFVCAEPGGLITALGVKLDDGGLVATDAQYQTSVPGIFAAGDMRRGQSLVVWAINEGRQAAHYMDRSLMGRSSLPLMPPGFSPRKG
jgi:glutamate synthase (NADPH/NADH) small chain